MLTEPIIEQRPAQKYMAIRSHVKMRDIPALLPPLVPKVIAWLAEKGIAEDGPVFFLYHSMEDDTLEVEVGVPVKTYSPGDGFIQPGTFPEGTYAAITYTGDYAHLKDAHMKLESWLAEKGLQEKIYTAANGVVWGGRTEFYLTDPDTEPDVSQWRTDVVFLLEPLHVNS
ncbi:MAG TPA: GyrI-like domain-containing protein [Ohtaekwangia sp.]|uniref:GyrI-like domain-containing protein n=1 Tax=Ohtaekwangia sp. TaxID=2066019 RepID=UPI002F91E495